MGVVLLLIFLVQVAVVVAVVGFARRHGRSWWLAAACGLVAYVVVLIGFRLVLAAGG